MTMHALESFGRIAAAFAALIVALGVLHRFGLGVWRAARRIEDTHTHVQRIPTIEAYGIETRRLVDDLSGLVMHELRPNGGSSMFDKVAVVEERSRTLEQRHAGRRSTDAS